MGLLDWLFKKKSVADAKPQGLAISWETSDSGNATVTRDNHRLTVFPHDGGWKFCIADAEDRYEPHFSDVYTHEFEAKEEAIARLTGGLSRHQPRSFSRREDGRQRWEALIEERERAIVELRKYLATNPDLGISALRKPEGKLKSWTRQLEWQFPGYGRNEVSQQLVLAAKQQVPAVKALTEEVQRRIAAKEATRPTPRPRVSNSNLPIAVAAKVDLLVDQFISTPVQDARLIDRRQREVQEKRIERMLDEGITYGQAGGGPDFLNQSEADFREFLKGVNQDLAWQCQTVSQAFSLYLETGDIPAPHYPMRVAILLRKAKDHERARRFLAGWCKHFPEGNGTTYAKLIERAKSIGAI
jgi:hypothetical protein